MEGIRDTHKNPSLISLPPHSGKIHETGMIHESRFPAHRFLEWEWVTVGGGVRVCVGARVGGVMGESLQVKKSGMQKIKFLLMHLLFSRCLYLRQCRHVNQM